MLARCVATLKPPPELTLSQWADRYRMLSAESSAEPGRWHTDKAPYQREIMDAIGDAHIRRVVIMCAAQLGKTELLLNILGYFMAYAPAPILVILDLLDKEEIKYRSEKRLLGYRNKGKRRLAGNANQPIIISIDDVADIIDVRAEDEFARVELLVSLKQELERLSPRELMIIRTYLDYPIEVVARKLKVRPNTISKARRKIARELRKKLV